STLIRSVLGSKSIIRRTTRSELYSSLRRAPAARSRSVVDLPTRPSGQFATCISSSMTLKRPETDYLSAESKSARSGTKYQLMLGMEVLPPDPIPRAETTPASPTSQTLTAIVGCCRNAVTGIADLLASYEMSIIAWVAAPSRNSGHSRPPELFYVSEGSSNPAVTYWLRSL